MSIWVNQAQFLPCDMTAASSINIASPPRPVHLHYGPRPQSTPSVHLLGPEKGGWRGAANGQGEARRTNTRPCGATDARTSGSTRSSIRPPAPSRQHMTSAPQPAAANHPHHTRAPTGPSGPPRMALAVRPQPVAGAWPSGHEAARPSPGLGPKGPRPVTISSSARSFRHRSPHTGR